MKYVIIMMIALIFITGCDTIDEQVIDDISVDISNKVDDMATKVNDVYQGFHCGDDVCEYVDGENHENCPLDCTETCTLPTDRNWSVNITEDCKI